MIGDMMTISREPAIWSAIVRQSLIVGMLFGMKLTTEQIIGISLLTELITTLFTRQSVTPNSKL